MNYDSFCMAAALDEIRSGFTGAFLDQVYQPEPLALVLAFTGHAPRRFWLLQCDARWPRSHALSARPAGPQTPPGFCALLRKHLNGARLVDAEQVRFDRILRLAFRRGDSSHELIHEVMGRHSNLILLDAARVVLGSIKSVPPAQTRVRPVLPGLPYQEPPGVRPDPRDLSLEDLRARLGTVGGPEELTRALSGWGTFAAREALARDGDPVAAVWAMMERVRRSDYAPRVFEDPAGRPRGVWVFPSAQEGWQSSRPAPTLSEACEAYYGHLEEHAAEDAFRRSLEGALQRALRTVRVQLQEAESNLDGVDMAEDLRVRGELLAAYGRPVERGTAHVEIPNWYDPAQNSLRIELDPELDLRENAARYFHRYRRGVAAAEAALDRIPLLRERAGRIEGLVREAAATDGAELRRLAERAAEFCAPGGAAHPDPGKTGARKPATSPFPRGVRIRRISAGAWEILYGENATSNDYLTTRWARPGDLWLHARAVTGCHVVIPNVQSLERLPQNVLREAARIAAAHSEARHSSVVAVDYTFRRYVRKPRGSAAGAVTYTGEKTLHVEPRPPEG